MNLLKSVVTKIFKTITSILNNFSKFLTVYLEYRDHKHKGADIEIRPISGMNCDEGTPIIITDSYTNDTEIDDDNETIAKKILDNLFQAVPDDVLDEMANDLKVIDIRNHQIDSGFEPCFCNPQFEKPFVQCRPCSHVHDCTTKNKYIGHNAVVTDSF